MVRSQADPSPPAAGERRLRILRDLAATMAEAKTPDAVCVAAASALEGSVSLPFSLAWIGEKFFRADPELRGGVAGLGLGLYLSHRLVELMDGRLWFESAEGAGSTFFVELPAR